MIIQDFPSGPVETNAYIVACPATKKAAIIDPAPGSFEAISQFITSEKLIPTVILLTHSHWDHIADVSKCKKAYNIPVWVHTLDSKNVEAPGADGLTCRVPIEGVDVDHFLEEDEEFTVGEIPFKVLWTPGHTPGGVCFYSAPLNALISGDTLFHRSMGRIDLPTGQPALMWKSLEKLSKLPPETKAYPGHGPTTTIGREAWLSNAENIFG